MTPKNLLLLGSLALLVSGCGGLSTEDQYFRELDMPYWETSQLKTPGQTGTKITPGLEAFYLNATLSNTARLY